MSHLERGLLWIKASVLQFASLLQLSFFVHLVVCDTVESYSSADRPNRRMQRTLSKADILNSRHKDITYC